MPLFPPRLCWPAPTRNLSNVHARTKLTSAVFGISKEQRRQRVLDLIKEPPRPVPEGHASFEVVGLRPALVDALHKAFPNVERPTPLQREFLPAIDDGKDVLLKDATGTGKCVLYLIRICTPDPYPRA
jgi:superfamily II DNA/RNA helicase